MKSNVEEIKRYIKEYPINDTCSARELNKFSKDLQRKIEEQNVSFSGEGKKTAIIYSGGLRNGSDSNAIYKLLQDGIKDGNIKDAYYISSTDGGAMLNQLGIPLRNKVGKNKASEILWGKGVGKDGERIAPYMNELGKQDGTLCLNSFCSQKYVEACKSVHLLLISCSGDALEQKALVTTELPNILNNEKITSINGISTDDLRRMRAEFEANGLSADESMVKVAEVLESSSANFVCMKDGENVLDYDKINEYISEGTVKQDLKPLEVAQNRETYDRSYGIEKSYENISAKDMYQCGGDAYVAKAIRNYANEYVQKYNGELNEQQRSELTKELGTKIREYYAEVERPLKTSKIENILEHDEIGEMFDKYQLSSDEIKSEVVNDFHIYDAEMGVTENTQKDFSLEDLGQKIEESMSNASRATGDLSVNNSVTDKMKNHTMRESKQNDSDKENIANKSSKEEEKDKTVEKAPNEKEKLAQEEQEKKVFVPAQKTNSQNDRRHNERTESGQLDNTNNSHNEQKKEQKTQKADKDKNVNDEKSHLIKNEKKDLLKDQSKEKSLSSQLGEKELRGNGISAANKISDEKLNAHMSRKAVVVKDDTSILKNGLDNEKGVREGQKPLDQSKALLNTELKRDVAITEMRAGQVKISQEVHSSLKNSDAELSLFGNKDVRIRERNINKTDTLNVSRKVVSSDNIKLKSQVNQENAQRIMRNSITITDKTNFANLGSKAKASASAIAAKAKGTVQNELDKQDDMSSSTVSAFIKTGGVAKNVAQKTYSTSKSIYNFSKRNRGGSANLRAGRGVVGKGAEKKVAQTAQRQVVQTAQKQAVKTAQKQVVKTAQKVAVKTAETTAKVAAKTVETTATTTATVAAAPVTMGASVAITAAKEVANAGVTVVKKTAEMVTKMSGMDGGNKGIMVAACVAAPIGLLVALIAVPLLMISPTLSFDFFGVDENEWLTEYLTEAREELIDEIEAERQELCNEGYEVRYRKMDGETIVPYTDAAVRNNCPSVDELKQFVQPLFHAKLIMETSDGIWDKITVKITMDKIADKIWEELIQVEHTDLPTEYCANPAADGVIYAGEYCPNKSERKYHNPPDIYRYSCCYIYCNGHIWYDCENEDHVKDSDHGPECPSRIIYCTGCKFACSGYYTCEGHPIAAVYVAMDKYIELLKDIVLDSIEELEVKEANGTISEEEKKDLNDLRTQYEFAIITMIFYAQENCPDQYVDTSDVQFTNLTSLACSFVGYPYEYGGNKPKRGIDCSGFTKYIYGQFGVTLPRTAAEQANCGQQIYGLSNAEPGDLIFWADGGSVSHVAIYLGNNKIVHASNSKPYPYGGIKISYADYNPPIHSIRRIALSQN